MTGANIQRIPNKRPWDIRYVFFWTIQSEGEILVKYSAFYYFYVEITKICIFRCRRRHGGRVRYGSHLLQHDHRLVSLLPVCFLYR